MAHTDICPDGRADPAPPPVRDAQELEILAEGLRDFFASRDAKDLALALKSLGWKKDGEKSLREAEHAFNRLFIGPGSVPAPPYSSVYLDAEPLLMGQSCMDVRQLAHDLGLERQGNEPDDHIARELGLWVILRRILSSLEPRGTNALRQELRASLAWFTHEHMAIWIPLFHSRAVETGDIPDCIGFALNRLGYWMNTCCQRRCYEG